MKGGKAERALRVLPAPAWLHFFMKNFLIMIVIFVLFYFFRNIFKVVVRLPALIFYKIYDFFYSLYTGDYKNFKGYGLHLYVGMFGSGKTLSLVRDVKALAHRYPALNIYTNIELIDFPFPDRIFKLTNYNQLITASPNSVFVIDEISTLFNSRKWSEFPFTLLSQLLQVRKNRKMILATAQRFSHVDKLIRDVSTTVTVCSCYFSRLCVNQKYDAQEYERAELYLPKCLDYVVYLASNKLRNSYDTYEIISDDVKSQFLSNQEVLQNRDYNSLTTASVVVEKPKKKFFRRK